ncbi:glycosyltransferase family 4 protein [Muricoccus pecuniae]|uniref:Glycosyltransferase involved in cell wall biosynthesis n=1 Tax=Muricoccus pecuniae TaxID=693023 RepID=A0A840XZN1_9PROT|nr:glycosyltransferase family 4 protein [Roseomonas pecuniae]MBB5692059.1 glycosyltransferase involved in cell wall biosynthesis [Roseomonas pecuniae]
MRVLFVANVDFALRHFILPLMRGARARGHEVFAACAEGPLLDLPRAEGFTVLPVPMARSFSPGANLRAFRALRRVVRDIRPDLVHAHFPISGLLARVAARMEGVPRTAYTVHGFLFNQPGRPWRRALSLAVEWLGGRLTDTFLTVSEEEARDARRLRIHPHPVAARNGRDPARFRPDAEARAALRAEIGAAPDEVVVTALSRLVRHKGYPELLRAMESVPGATLWVVGERLASDHGADLEPDFARAAEALGPRLRRLGYRHDTERVLAASDIFCLPSHFEGLPMSVIEAMLTGLPVVATDIRGPREQVVVEGTGLLVPPATVAPLAEALNRLAGDAALRARMGAAGRERALALYDERAVVERTLDLLGL